MEVANFFLLACFFGLVCSFHGVLFLVACSVYLRLILSLLYGAVL